MKKLNKLLHRFQRDQAQYEGRTVYTVSMSGGKDSTATALWAMRNLSKKGYVKFYTADTGWEHPETYKYLDYLRAKLQINIEVIRSEKYNGFEDMCVSRKMFPSRVNRICTQELKIYPSQKYLKTLQRQMYNVINVTGVRAEESQARSREQKWKFSFYMNGSKPTKLMYKLKEGITTYQPLVHWTTQQVFDIHRKYGIKPNPLYKKGFTRVGCYPCVMATVKEVGMIDKDRVKKVAELEDKVSVAAGAQRVFWYKGGDVIEFSVLNGHYKDKYGGQTKTCFNQFGICE